MELFARSTPPLQSACGAFATMHGHITHRVHGARCAPDIRFLCYFLFHYAALTLFTEFDLITLINQGLLVLLFQSSCDAFCYDDSHGVFGQ